MDLQKEIEELKKLVKTEQKQLSFIYPNIKGPIEMGVEIINQLQEENKKLAEGLSDAWELINKLQNVGKNDHI